MVGQGMSGLARRVALFGVVAVLLAACGGSGGASAGQYGSDPALDALWDACDDGDEAACAELGVRAPAGSEYAAFADTCGARNRSGGGCSLGTAGDDPLPGFSGESYGDDPVLDALWDACDGGDNDACDRLYFDSPAGSEYEAFGGSCGARNDPAGLCTDIYGGGAGGGGTRDAYGDDPVLDSLWDDCAGGDYAACDQLFFESPAGSVYEAFGGSCGERNEPAGLCVDVYSSGSGGGVDDYGDDPVLDSLWDDCAGGDYAACDDLYFDSPIGSVYEAFGDSCGERNEPAGLCVDMYSGG